MAGPLLSGFVKANKDWPLLWFILGENFILFYFALFWSMVMYVNQVVTKKKRLNQPQN